MKSILGQLLSTILSDLVVKTADIRFDLESTKDRHNRTEMWNMSHSKTCPKPNTIELDCNSPNCRCKRYNLGFDFSLRLD